MSNPPASPGVVRFATVTFTLLLVFNVVYDALSDKYQGYEITFGLMTLVGALLGVGKIIRGGDEK